MGCKSSDLHLGERGPISNGFPLIKGVKLQPNFFINTMIHQWAHCHLAQIVKNFICTCLTLMTVILNMAKCLNQWFSMRGDYPQETFCNVWRHFFVVTAQRWVGYVAAAMQQGKPRDAANHPKMHRTVHHNKELFILKYQQAKVEKLQLMPIKLKTCRLHCVTELLVILQK